jgi:hypothetical protein
MKGCASSTAGFAAVRGTGCVRRQSNVPDTAASTAAVLI